MQTANAITVMMAMRIFLRDDAEIFILLPSISIEFLQQLSNYAIRVVHNGRFKKIRRKYRSVPEYGAPGYRVSGRGAELYSDVP
jgi:hypothetical protein